MTDEQNQGTPLELQIFTTGLIYEARLPGPAVVAQLSSIEDHNVLVIGKALTRYRWLGLVSVVLIPLVLGGYVVAGRGGRFGPTALGLSLLVLMASAAYGFGQYYRWRRRHIPRSRMTAARALMESVAAVVDPEADIDVRLDLREVDEEWPWNRRENDGQRIGELENPWAKMEGRLSGAKVFRLTALESYSTRQEILKPGTGGQGSRFIVVELERLTTVKLVLEGERASGIARLESPPGFELGPVEGLGELALIVRDAVTSHAFTELVFPVTEFGLAAASLLACCVLDPNSEQAL